MQTIANIKDAFFRTCHRSFAPSWDFGGMTGSEEHDSSEDEDEKSREETPPSHKGGAPQSSARGLPLDNVGPVFLDFPRLATRIAGF